MKEYILKFKGLRYSLQVANYKSIDDDMVIEMVLDGLTPYYRMFRSILHCKQLTFQTLTDLLIQEEMLINKFDLDDKVCEISANYVS